MSKCKSGEKPRLLVIHSALVPYRLDIFNAMSKICELKLALLTQNNANQHFDQSDLISRLDVEPVYIARKFRAFKRDFPSGVGEVIRKFNPDIVVTDEFSVTTFIAAYYKLMSKSKFCHVIWTDDNQEVINIEGTHRRVARWILIHLVEGWMFISPEIQSYYEKVFNVTKPSAIVPVTHDEYSFRKQLKRSGHFFEKIVDEYNLRGKRILLFVGRLVELKGIDLLLRAYVDVIPQVYNTMLIIVGEGEERQNLEALASELKINDHVRFVGRYEGVELLAWYRAGQVFALASHFECFGAVVNEALLAGLPAVVSSYAGARSLIDDGINGSIVFPENTDLFTKELIKWLERAEPLSIDETIKPNLMGTEYAEVVSSVSNLFASLTSAQPIR